MSRDDHKIERAMLFARRQCMRDVLKQIAVLRLMGGNLSALNDWAALKECVQSRGLEQARTGDGAVPEELREEAIEADAKEMIETIRGFAGSRGAKPSVVVEHEGKRAVFKVSGWSVPDGEPWTLYLDPQENP